MRSAAVNSPLWSRNLDPNTLDYIYHVPNRAHRTDVTKGPIGIPLDQSLKFRAYKLEGLRWPPANEVSVADCVAPTALRTK